MPDTSTSILIGLALYYEDGGWIAELCDIEAAFLHPNMKANMYMEWSEGIVDLRIISKEFLIEYCILIRKSMCGNVEVALLWIILLYKYLVNECNLKKSNADLWIIFQEYEKGKMELVMSVHVDEFLMAGKSETLKIIN